MYNFPISPAAGTLYAPSGGPSWRFLDGAWQQEAPAGYPSSIRFETVSQATAATIPADINAIELTGYYAAGDGGGALYKRVISDPGHAGKIHSLDGAWWELSETIVSPKMFGAKGDAATDDFTAFQGCFAGFTRIHIPAGEYKLSDGVEIKANTLVTGHGVNSKLTTTGTNKRVLWAYQNHNIRVRDLFINGNLTGVGNTSQGAAGGDGIGFDECNDIEISGCIFDNIGKPTYLDFASCIWVTQAKRVRILNNKFLPNSKSRTGADISCSYYVSESYIAGNHSLSEHDEFISMSAVGIAESDTINHVITGNYARRSDTSDARSGILVSYAKIGMTTVTGNVIENFPANGIYLAGLQGTSDLDGGATVTGNLVRFCGGTNTMLNLSGGIYISGFSGQTVTGNLVLKSGYRSDGVARTNAVAGIFSQAHVRDILIANNVVKWSRGEGVRVVNGSDNVANVAIRGNTLVDNVAGGVMLIFSNPTPTNKNFVVDDNLIDQTGADFDGINVSIQTSGIQTDVLSVQGNMVIGAPSSVKYGFTSNCGGNIVNWRVANNIFKSWARGVSVASGLMLDKEVGTKLIFDGNTLDTCTVGFWFGIGAGKQLFVFNTTMIAVGTEYLDGARVFPARALGGGRFEVRNNALPVDGAWQIGDMIVHRTPVAAGFIGWVCTTAGSPGTWKTYGAISA